MNRARLEAFLLGSFALALGCAGVKQSPGTRQRGLGHGPGIGGFGGSMTVAMPCMGMCMDFPRRAHRRRQRARERRHHLRQPSGSALQRRSVPGRAARMDTLFPNNWLRPRFRVVAPAGQDLYEIRLHASNQANDLVVVHDQNDLDDAQGHLDAARRPLARHADQVTCAARRPAAGQVAGRQRGHITIAPVGANGKMVYWSTAGTTLTASRPGRRDRAVRASRSATRASSTVLKPDKARRRRSR